MLPALRGQDAHAAAGEDPSTSLKAGAGATAHMRNQFLTVRLYRLLILLAAAWAHGQQPMLRVEGESFAGRKVVLPDGSRGRVAVLIFGFTKASKGPTSGWGDKISSEFASQAGFDLYQLPVLEDVPRFIRGMVISGIKKGVKENMRDQFVPVLQGESDLKKLVSFKEPDDAYIVILDPAGQIVHQMHGPFSDAAYGQVREKLHALLSH